MIVSREQFVSFIRKNPDLVGNPIEGQTIVAMQYLDSAGKVKAQAIYSSPVPGCKVIPCYTITEGN